MIEIEKAYNPENSEEKWSSYWEFHKLYRSEIDTSRKPYTIVIPPPNITGMLHLGHILNNTIQDILIRLHRMKGFNACWVPGTDHASIATETKVVNYLKESGISKQEIGRDEFLKHCFEWKEKYGGIIISQLKKLGVSCDWERLRFTMDEAYSKSVIEAFVHLYREGKIFRGYRLVNWDPASRSAISDEEVEFREVNGKLWHLRYPVAGLEGKFVVVATTRPETMLGDTAVAVNPLDARYKDLIGKELELPLTVRKIKIIADEFVDSEFGTGAVKVTPAHDPNDYEMGKRHNLEFINILTPEGYLNENTPVEYKGLDRFEARKKVVESLKNLDLLEKIEDYKTNIGYSQRGGVPIEPYLSEQWFMKMDELAAPAVKAVKDGAVKFYPGHWVKTYENWMKNIREWCISRQLWWGHRIPVWYNNKTGEIYCDVNPPSDPENWTQDPDVLDTWASSWLWAHEVFRNEEEIKYYYPTDTLVTGPDIIFFWVARMIMAGTHFRGDIPFKNVYYTSIIRDDLGRKMSKTLGNSPDPLEVIKEYGTDALRFTVIYIAPLGQDVLFSTEKCEIGRNFANKIWNAGRFILMNTPEGITKNDKPVSEPGLIDKWIESRFNNTLKDLEHNYLKFEFNNASKTIYGYVWNDFCDWYLEMIKNKFYSGDETIKRDAAIRALNLFEDLLKIVHPFMPFLTEELWQSIFKRENGESISTSEYPVVNESKISLKVESDTLFLQNIISALRNIRGEMNVAPSKTISVYLKSDKYDPLFNDLIKKLAKVESIEILKDDLKPSKSASAVINDCEIFVPLEGLIDLDSERNRLNKEIIRITGAISGIEKKLSNESFVSKAPADVIEKEKQKLQDWNANLKKLQEILDSLS